MCRSGGGVGGYKRVSFNLEDLLAYFLPESDEKIDTTLMSVWKECGADEYASPSL